MELAEEEGWGVSPLRGVSGGVGELMKSLECAELVFLVALAVSLRVAFFLRICCGMNRRFMWGVGSVSVVDEYYVGINLKVLIRFTGHTSSAWPKFSSDALPSFWKVVQRELSSTTATRASPHLPHPRRLPAQLPTASAHTPTPPRCPSTPSTSSTATVHLSSARSPCSQL